jgi:hypothetical protein
MSYCATILPGKTPFAVQFSLNNNNNNNNTMAESKWWDDKDKLPA